MKKLLFLFILFSILSNKVFSQNFKLSNSITSSSKVRTAELKSVSDGVLFFGDYMGTLNVTGNPTADSRDIILAKYDDSFELVWLQQIGGTLKDWAYDLVIHDNYIYIVGRYQGTCIFDGGTETLTALGSVYDAFIAKYKLDGTFVWAKPLAYNEADQQATTIDIDKNNDLIIGGFYTDSITFESEKFIASNGMFISKVDTSGAVLWANNIPANDTKSQILAVSAFEDGYYFTGNVQGSATFDIGAIASNDPLYSDVFLYKTGFTGTGSWLRKTYGYGSADTKTGTITGDDFGNVYFTGLYGGTYIEVDKNSSQKSETTLINNGSLDAFIIKYNKTGDLSWHYDYGNLGEEWARDIQYKNGFLYLTGYFSDTLFVENDTLVSSDPLDYDALLAMFDPDGNLIRAAQIEDANDGTTSGIAIDVDDNNNAYWSGNFKSSQIIIGDSTFNKTGVQSAFISSYKSFYSTAFTKKQDVTCNKGNDGELIITPYFGVPPFTYLWSDDGGRNDSIATGLSAGTYTVTVTDALDSVDVKQYTILEPDSFLFNPIITQVATCSYSLEGAININVTGGNGGNSYAWTGTGTILTAEDQTGLGIGSYMVTATDSKGCSSDTTINIIGPNPINFGNSIITDYMSPLSKGDIDLETDGGTGLPTSFTYQWQGPLGTYTYSEDTVDLDAGTYNVTVTDINACSFDTSFVVLDSDTLYAYISYKKDDCTGGVGDGKAKVSYFTNEPSPDISYHWSHDAGLNDSLATELPVGKYYVTVTDNNVPESYVDSVIIVDLAYTMAGNLNSGLPTSVDCKGDSDGVIDLTVTDPGVLPYTYNWSNGDTTQDLINVPAAIYSVTVIDDNECSLFLSNYTISEPALELTVPSPSITSYILCYGDLNGALLADPSGGNGGYSYNWNDPGNQASNPATGLGAGFYTVTVTDFKGCTASAGVSLTEPDALTISGTLGHLNCFGDNSGTIALSIGGGTPPDSYFWTASNGGGGLVAVDKNQSGLSAGDYYVTVTDQNFCEETDSFKLTEPTQLVIDSEDKIDVSTCNGDNTGEISISASGGTGILTYTLNPEAIQTNNSGAFSGIHSGTYTVDVDDENSCGLVSSGSIVVSEPEVISLENSNSINPTCNGESNGSIDITINGGTVVSEYTYTWETSDGTGIVSDAEDQTSLSAGTYDVTVTDDNSCTSAFSIALDNPTEITIDSENSTDATANGISDGTVTVAASGGTGDIEYTLTPGSIVNSTGIFTDLAPDTYVVSVTDDNSCGPLESNSITVGVGDAIDDISESDKILLYPNPTSDKIFIEYDSDFNNMKLEILSISGQVIINKELKSYGIIKEEIDLSAYPKGMYFVRIYNNTFNYKSKVLLQ